MDESKIKVLLAKPGLDGHDRGAKFLARAFRDAGMEVIYTGLHQKISQIVMAALQEDVDVVGMSIMSGSHLGLTRKYFKQCLEKGLSGPRPLVIVGGTIPQEDIEELKSIGVDGVFGVESDVDVIIQFIRAKVGALEEVK